MIRNYGILDEHYTLNKDKYTNFSKRNYSIINDGIENKNKKILKNQLETIEIGLLNGTNKFKEIFENFDEKITVNQS